MPLIWQSSWHACQQAAQQAQAALVAAPPGPPACPALHMPPAASTPGTAHAMAAPHHSPPSPPSAPLQHTHHTRQQPPHAGLRPLLHQQQRKRQPRQTSTSTHTNIHTHVGMYTPNSSSASRGPQASAAARQGHKTESTSHKRTAPTASQCGACMTEALGQGPTQRLGPAPSWHTRHATEYINIKSTQALNASLPAASHGSSPAALQPSAVPCSAPRQQQVHAVHAAVRLPTLSSIRALRGSPAGSRWPRTARHMQWLHQRLAPWHACSNAINSRPTPTHRLAAHLPSSSRLSQQAVAARSRPLYQPPPAPQAPLCTAPHCPLAGAAHAQQLCQAWL